MTLNFGLLLFALSAEQLEMSTAMLNTLRADMVNALFMLRALHMFHSVCPPFDNRKNTREPRERQPMGVRIESRNAEQDTMSGRRRRAEEEDVPVIHALPGLANLLALKAHLASPQNLFAWHRSSNADVRAIRR